MPPFPPLTPAATASRPLAMATLVVSSHPCPRSGNSCDGIWPPLTCSRSLHACAHLLIYLPSVPKAEPMKHNATQAPSHLDW
eukprot:1153394-Pelagomonas_calceolata.AAC.1